jgi:hypothetical protein
MLVNADASVYIRMFDQSSFQLCQNKNVINLLV